MDRRQFLKGIAGTAAGLAWEGLTPRAAAGQPLPLSAAEVAAIVQRAIGSVHFDTTVVAVADRTGQILALFRRPSANPADDEIAAGVARTAAFFSHNQAPLSSRTVRFISGIHFPPGIRNTPNAALYGIENSNRGGFLAVYNPGKEFPRSLNLPGTGPGPGIVTGKADLFDSIARAVNPGGVPIYRDGEMLGGVGVAGVPGPAAEFAAFTGSRPGPNFGSRPARPRVLFVDGIQLPFVKQKRPPRGVGPRPVTGSFVLGPVGGGLAPDGYLVGPAGSPELTVAEVDLIVQNSVIAASRTRAAIRLPLGSRTRMVIGVGDLEGNILALFRMPDSTTFSVDVAATKARNVVYSSSLAVDPADLPGVPPGTAVSNRTINFGAQPLFPAGIDDTQPGPFFDLFQFDSNNPWTQGRQPPDPLGRQSGVVFFPGSLPLYKGGALVGGLGISGDGVDQDDYVAFLGAAGFEAPPAIRADRILIRGVRLPYLKFPRNPER